MEVVTNTRSANNPQRSSTAATWLLVLTCLALFPVGLRDPTLSCSYDQVFIYARWWTVVTALFMHGNIGHLLGNMLFLFLFGRGLERYIGSSGLLAVFLIGGIISMFISIFYYPHNMPSVGASGAISAILATLMLFNPWKTSFLLNLFPMPLGVAGFTFLLLNVAGFFRDRYTQPHGGLQVAYLAHLIGFVAGVIFGIILTPDWKKNLLLCLLQFACYYLLLLLILHYIHYL
jgi:membrane associated rhomboid family serine protease